MITYDHFYYLHNAIVGVLNQECDFEFELIISDDCSPIDPSSILENLKDHKKFSSIKYFRHQVNKGPSENYLWSLKQCQGDYVANCEGDDFWVDLNKLQKQVQLLDTNSNIIATCSNSITIDETGKSLNKDFLINNDMILSTEDIIGYTYYNFIPTASVVFRNIKDSIFISEFKKLKGFDWSLLFLLSLKGNIFFDSNPMVAYRITGKGLNSQLNEIEKIKNVIDLYALFGFFYPKFEHLCRIKINECFEHIKYLHNKNHIEENQYLKSKILDFEFDIQNLEQIISFKEYIKIGLKKIKLFFKQL